MVQDYSGDALAKIIFKIRLIFWQKHIFNRISSRRKTGLGKLSSIGKGAPL